MTIDVDRQMEPFAPSFLREQLPVDVAAKDGAAGQANTAHDHSWGCGCANCVRQERFIIELRASAAMVGAGSIRGNTYSPD